MTQTGVYLSLSITRGVYLLRFAHASLRCWRDSSILEELRGMNF